MSIRQWLQNVILTITFCVIVGLFLNVSHTITARRDSTRWGSNRPSGIRPSSSNGMRRVLFSPDDEVREALIKLIDEETESIHIAIFTITDKQIVEALIRAHERGVIVELVTDRTCAATTYSKVDMLREAGIQIYLYPKARTTSRNASLMHNKFVIFGHTSRQQLIWTGSFNFTRTADTANQENVIIFNDTDLVTQYRAQFAKLKDRSSAMRTYKHEEEATQQDPSSLERALHGLGSLL